MEVAKLQTPKMRMCILGVILLIILYKIIES